MTDLNDLELADEDDSYEEPFAREGDLILIVGEGEKRLLPVVGFSDSERVVFSRDGDKRIEVPYDDAIVLRQGNETGYSVGKNLRRGTFLAQLEDYDRVKILDFKKEEIEKPVLGISKGHYYSNWGLRKEFHRRTRKILKTLETGHVLVDEGFVFTQTGSKKYPRYHVNEDETEFVEKTLESPALKDYLSRLESLTGQETETKELRDYFLKELKEQFPAFVSFFSILTPEGNFEARISLGKRYSMREPDFICFGNLASLTLEPVR